MYFVPAAIYAATLGIAFVCRKMGRKFDPNTEKFVILPSNI